MSRRPSPSCHIFRRYVQLRSVRALQAELDGAGIRSKRRVFADGFFDSALFGLPMTEIPLGYGMFCFTFDLTVAGYLTTSDTAWDEPGKFDLYFWRNYFWRNRP